MNRTDADVTIFFLTTNNIEFVTQNHDPIFSANRPALSSLGAPVFKPDNNISILGCAEQHQYCNPNIAESSSDRCTKLSASELLWGPNHVEDFQLLQDTGLTQLHNTSIHLNPFQEIIAGYSSATLSAGMYFSVFSRGAAALKGKIFDLFPHHMTLMRFLEKLQKPFTNTSRVNSPTINGLLSFRDCSPLV